MRGRILLVASAEPRRGRARPPARQPAASGSSATSGSSSAASAHAAVVRPAPPAPQRALEHGAVRHLPAARGGVRDPLVLAVHRPRDPAAPRRRPSRVAGDAAGDGSRRGWRPSSVLPLIVLGAGSQNLLWAFQIGFLGSVALGLGAMLLVNHAGAWQRRDWAGARRWRSSRCSGRASRCCSSSSAPSSCCCAAGSSRRPRSRFRRPSSTSSGRSPTRRPTDLAAPTVRAFSDDLWPFVATGLSTAADAFVLDAPLLGSIGLVLLALYLVRTAERATTEAGGRCTRAPPGRSPSSSSRPTAGRSSASGRRRETRYGYIAIILLAPAIAMVADRLLRRASTPCRAPRSWSSS